MPSLNATIIRYFEVVVAPLQGAVMGPAYPRVPASPSPWAIIFVAFSDGNTVLNRFSERDR